MDINRMTNEEIDNLLYSMAAGHMGKVELTKEERHKLRVEHIKRKAKFMGVKLAPIIFALIFMPFFTKTTYAAAYIPNEAIQEAKLYLSANYVDVPAEIEELCIKYGEINGIPPELLEALIWKESRFLPEVQGGACIGLMQVNPNCHRHRMEKVGATDLFDPEDNIATGSDYLAELLEDTNDIGMALMLYNGDKRAYNQGYISSYAKKIIKISKYLELAKL